VQEKKIAPSLNQLQHLRTYGLQATATLWLPLQNAYRFVYQAKEILAHPEQGTGHHVRKRYLAHLSQMQRQKKTLGPLESAFEHFCHQPSNFAAGLFHCYERSGLVPHQQ